MTKKRENKTKREPKKITTKEKIQTNYQRTSTISCIGRPTSFKIALYESSI